MLRLLMCVCILGCGFQTAAKDQKPVAAPHYFLSHENFMRLSPEKQEDYVNKVFTILRNVRFTAAEREAIKHDNPWMYMLLGLEAAYAAGTVNNEMNELQRMLNQIKNNRFTNNVERDSFIKKTEEKANELSARIQKEYDSGKASGGESFQREYQKHAAEMIKKSTQLNELAKDKVSISTQSIDSSMNKVQTETGERRAFREAGVPNRDVPNDPEVRGRALKDDAQARENERVNQEIRDRLAKEEAERKKQAEAKRVEEERKAKEDAARAAKQKREMQIEGARDMRSGRANNQPLPPGVAESIGKTLGDAQTEAEQKRLAEAAAKLKEARVEGKKAGAAAKYRCLNSHWFVENDPTCTVKADLAEMFPELIKNIKDNRGAFNCGTNQQVCNPSIAGFNPEVECNLTTRTSTREDFDTALQVCAKNAGNKKLVKCRPKGDQDASANCLQGKNQNTAGQIAAIWRQFPKEMGNQEGAYQAMCDGKGNFNYGTLNKQQQAAIEKDIVDTCKKAMPKIRELTVMVEASLGPTSDTRGTVKDPNTAN